MQQHELSAGFSVQNGDDPIVPVLISVPHAGRDYPQPIFDNLRIAPVDLLRLEDRYADLLARDVAKAGFPVIIAHKARTWIDLNRDTDDIDVEMIVGLARSGRPAPGAKQRGGLGLIPRRLSGSGEIWKGKFDAASLAERIDSFHRPYHDSIAAILKNMRDRFGVAILLDLHSMPSIDGAQFVVGDRFGRSSASRYSEMLMAVVRDRGFDVALNHPYSGEYMLRRHGNVGRNVHAIQLEVDRALYLDASFREPGVGVSATSALVAELTQCLAEIGAGQQTLLAAE